MLYVVSRQGFPTMYVNTPEGAERIRLARERAEAKLPVVFEGEINGRPSRVRGFMDSEDGPWGLCEYLYNGTWRRLKNAGLCAELKNQWNE